MVAVMAGMYTWYWCCREFRLRGDLGGIARSCCELMIRRAFAQQALLYGIVDRVRMAGFQRLQSGKQHRSRKHQGAGAAIITRIEFAEKRHARSLAS